MLQSSKNPWARRGLSDSPDSGKMHGVTHAHESKQRLSPPVGATRAERGKWDLWVELLGNATSDDLEKLRGRMLNDSTLLPSQKRMLLAKWPPDAPPPSKETVRRLSSLQLSPTTTTVATRGPAGPHLRLADVIAIILLVAVSSVLVLGAVTVAVVITWIIWGCLRVVVGCRRVALPLTVSIRVVVRSELSLTPLLA